MSAMDAAMRNCFCMNFDGPQIEDCHFVAVYYAAQMMLEEENNRLKLEGEGMEGLVTTTFKSVTVGSLTGFLFNVELDCGDKTHKATFLCRRMAHWREQVLEIGEYELPDNFKIPTELAGN